PESRFMARPRWMPRAAPSRGREPHHAIKSIVRPSAPPVAPTPGPGRPQCAISIDGSLEPIQPRVALGRRPSDTGSGVEGSRTGRRMAMSIIETWTQGSGEPWRGAGHLTAAVFLAVALAVTHAGPAGAGGGGSNAIFSLDRS